MSRFHASFASLDGPVTCRDIVEVRQGVCPGAFPWTLKWTNLFLIHVLISFATGLSSYGFPSIFNKHSAPKPRRVRAPIPPNVSHAQNVPVISSCFSTGNEIVRRKCRLSKTGLICGGTGPFKSSLGGWDWNAAYSGISRTDFAWFLPLLSGIIL